MEDLPFGFVKKCRCCAPLSLLEDEAEVAERVVLDMNEEWPGSTVFDSHCHIHIDSKDAVVPDGYFAVVQSIAESDWAAAVDFCEKNPQRLRPAFGIHPWQAHEVDTIDLETMLQSHPLAPVGEIGLCKCAKNVRGPLKESGFAAQLRVFKQQLQAAATLSRPVSIHCVKAQNPMLEALKAVQGIPSIALHSFSGTAHHVKQLLKHYEASDTCVYFGFSYTINVQLNSKAQVLAAAILAVPDNRILVESDLDDIALAPEATRKAVALIAGIKQWSLDYTAKLTTANARAWLHPNTSCVNDELATLTPSIISGE